MSFGKIEVIGGGQTYTNDIGGMVAPRGASFKYGWHSRISTKFASTLRVGSGSRMG